MMLMAMSRSLNTLGSFLDLFREQNLVGNSSSSSSSRLPCLRVVVVCVPTTICTSSLAAHPFLSVRHRVTLARRQWAWRAADVGELDVQVGTLVAPSIQATRPRHWPMGSVIVLPARLTLVWPRSSKKGKKSPPSSATALPAHQPPSLSFFLHSTSSPLPCTLHPTLHHGWQEHVSIRDRATFSCLSPNRTPAMSTSSSLAPVRLVSVPPSACSSSSVLFITKSPPPSLTASQDTASWMIVDSNETPGGLASTDVTPEGFVR